MIDKRRIKVFYLNTKKDIIEFIDLTIHSIYKAIIFTVIFKIVLDISI